MRCSGDRGAAAGRRSVNGPVGGLREAATAVPDRDVQAARGVTYLDFLLGLRPVFGPTLGYERRPAEDCRPKSTVGRRAGSIAGSTTEENPGCLLRVRARKTHHVFCGESAGDGRKTFIGRPPTACGEARARAAVFPEVFWRRPPGAAGISGTWSERNPAVSLRVRVAENGNRRLAHSNGVGSRVVGRPHIDPKAHQPALPVVSRGWGLPESDRLERDPTAHPREYLGGFSKIGWPRFGR